MNYCLKRRKQNGSNQHGEKWTTQNNKRTRTSGSLVWETDPLLVLSWRLHWTVHTKQLFNTNRGEKTGLLSVSKKQSHLTLAEKKTEKKKKRGRMGKGTKT